MFCVLCVKRLFYTMFRIQTVQPVWALAAVGCVLAWKTKKECDGSPRPNCPCRLWCNHSETKEKNGLNIWLCNNRIKASGKYLAFVWDSFKQQRIFSLRLLPVQWSCDFSSASWTLVEKNCLRARLYVCVWAEPLVLLCSIRIHLGWKVEQSHGRHRIHTAGRTLKTDASCRASSAHYGSAHTLLDWII